MRQDVFGDALIALRAGSIKSIQRGTITTVNATGGTATITAVNTAKATLRLLGFSSTASGATNPNALYPRIELTNATTVTLTFGGTGSATVIASFEVEEKY